MPRYQVLINGRNFLIDMDGKLERHGLYTTRWVEAADEAAAELAAVDALRSDERLRKSVRNAPDDPPMLFAEKITELTEEEWKRRGKSGFIWYSQDDEEEPDDGAPIDRDKRARRAQSRRPYT